MGTVHLTRKEIDQGLSRKYLGKVVIFIQIDGKEVCGKVDRITCEAAIQRQPMAIFVINHTRYEVDVSYFINNTRLCKRDNGGTGSSSP